MKAENPYFPSPLSKGPRFISEYLPERTNGLNPKKILSVEKPITSISFDGNKGVEHTVFQANLSPNQAEPVSMESLPIHPIPQH